MDWLIARQARMEDQLAQRHLAEGSLVLYDLTSTYFEGRKCPLAAWGHSRDERSGNPQIVFGLLRHQEGCPVAVEVFEGNTADPKTVAAQIQKLRQRFGLKEVVLVGDRGMLTSARIREDLETAEGVRWITALRAGQIQRLAVDGHLQLSLFDEQDLAEIQHPAYPGERLIACRNPLLAEDRKRKREELLKATEKHWRRSWRQLSGGAGRCAARKRLAWPSARHGAASKWASTFRRPSKKIVSAGSASKAISSAKRHS